ncbi:MAG: insulinase family protein [Myxococcales bacterium]|nr:insulinase family protein [Myxococcales bacterium]
MRTAFSALLPAGALALLSCSPAPKPPVDVPPASSVSATPSASTTASAPPPVTDFRSKPPAPEGTVTFTPPKIVELAMKDGPKLRVLFVERHELPIVAVQVVTDRGATDAPPGRCSFMASMLQQGTKKHDALAFADEMERLGARWGSSCGYDSVVVYGQVLSGKLGALLPLLSEMITTPSFDAKEIERERKKRLTQLQQQKDSPSALSWRTVLATLYPSVLPYALPTIGDEGAVKAITKAELEAARKATLTPAATTIIVVGDVTEATLMPMLGKAFGGWKEASPKRVEIPAYLTEAPKERPILVIDRPGASQSTVSLARVGELRNTPEWAQIFLTNYVFGGHFASRINMNLREAHAYTYGAGSSFSMWQMAGPFTVGGEIKTEHTAAAIKEILAELARMRDAPITDEELAEAKTGLVDQLPGRFTTMEDTANALATLVSYHLPLNEYADRPSKVGAVTKADVQRQAKKYLAADDLRIVIVGDAAKITPGLEGLKLGKVEVRKP